MTPYQKQWGNMAIFDQPPRSRAPLSSIAAPATFSAAAVATASSFPERFPRYRQGRVAIADSSEFSRLFSGGSVY
jgi:hypothetical protein